MNYEPSSLVRLRRSPKVRDASVDGPDGYYIELRRGWSFDPFQDNRVTIAPTVSEAVRCVRAASKFEGPFDD